MHCVLGAIGMLLACIAFVLPCRAEPPPKPSVYNAEKDPLAWFLTSAELQKLSETLAHAQQAVYFIGSPERGIIGTAFCISKEHRLLVTCATIIDDVFDRHKLTLVDAVGQQAPMRRFWFHPDFLRMDANGKPVHPDKAPKGEIAPASPDVAIIQLRENAPAPRGELTLLPPDHGGKLLGHAVGVLHFSTFVQPRWPTETDLECAPFRSFGYVTGIEKLQTADAKTPTRPWHLRVTAATWEAMGGAPVLLQDGTVIGMVNSSGVLT
ncbi:MAG: hypothetical protein G01um1014106_706, partial [Parcubacteria group bacterium Gr01-1014_106]